MQVVRVLTSVTKACLNYGVDTQFSSLYSFSLLGLRFEKKFDENTKNKKYKF